MVPQDTATDRIHEEQTPHNEDINNNTIASKVRVHGNLEDIDGNPPEPLLGVAVDRENLRDDTQCIDDRIQGARNIMTLEIVGTRDSDCKDRDFIVKADGNAG